MGGKTKTSWEEGEKRNRGRPKGSQNKVTQAAKEAIEKVFDDLGGADGLYEWTLDDPANKRIFYGQVWPKILPKEIKADVNHRGWFDVLAGLGSDKKDD